VQCDFSAIGGGYMAARATRELHAADDINAANELIGLEQLSETI
jgi:hypothetical protein